jgi:hypothetical protein
MVFAATLTAPVSFIYRLIPWLEVVCLIMLLAAASLHWRRTRHWCLLALATGALLMAMGAIAMQIAQMLASGAMSFDKSLRTIPMWVVASGVVVAAVGGVGAVHWAIRLRRDSKH